MKIDQIMTNSYSNQDIAYLRCAFVLSELSKAIRKRVGSILVSYDNKIPYIISDGVNGTDPGNSNICEDRETGQTLDSVIHAEENCLNKIKDQDIKFLKSTLYVTFQPCPNCCDLIIKFNQKNSNKKITRVVYCYEYKNKAGLDRLVESGIELVRIPMNDKLSWDLNLRSEMHYNFSGVYRSLGHSEENVNEFVKILLMAVKD